jgi:COP9 signalosome complex subunit 2
LDDLFESFKRYLEIADNRAKTILKYTILASILANSKINFSTTREAKTYAQDKEIMLINELRTSFEQNDINNILRIMNHKDSHITDDPVISAYLDDLMRSIRLKVIISRVKPYKTVSLDHLANQLKVDRVEICGLLSELILEEDIIGQID